MDDKDSKIDVLCKVRLQLAQILSFDSYGQLICKRCRRRPNWSSDDADNKIAGNRELNSLVSGAVSGSETNL